MTRAAPHRSGRPGTSVGAKQAGRAQNGQRGYVNLAAAAILACAWLALSVVAPTQVAWAAESIYGPALVWESRNEHPSSHFH